MVSDGYVRVSCDTCGAEVEIEMCAIARGGYDTRNVNQSVERMGWTCEGQSIHYCEDCSNEEQEEES